MPPAEYPSQAGIWIMKMSDFPLAPPSTTTMVNDRFATPFTVPYPVTTARFPEMFSTLKEVAFKETFKP